MAIGTPVAGSTQSNNSSSTATYAYPSGITAGDLLLCVCYISISSTFQPTLPSGWTNIQQTRSDTSTPTTRVFYKFASGSESGTFNNTIGGFANWITKMWRISGVDTSTPIDVTPSVFGSGAKVTVFTVPGITTVTDGCQLWGFGSANANSGSYATPTGFTEELDYENDVVPIVWAGYSNQVSAGATGDVDIDYSGTARGHGILFALRPAPTGEDLTQGATDAAGLADSSARSAARVGNATDGAGLAEASVRSMARKDTRSDPVGVSESSLRALSRSITPTDQAGLGDSAMVVLSKLQQATDPTGMGDAATPVRVRSVQASDSTGLADSALLRRALGRSTTDPSGLGEGVVVSRVHGATRQDTTGLGESTTRAFACRGSGLDSVGLADASVRGVRRLLAPVEQTGLASTAQPWLAKRVTALGQVGLADAAQLKHGVVRKPVDTVGLADTAQASLTSASGVEVTEGVGLADSAQIALVRRATFGDSCGVNDARMVGAHRQVSHTDLVHLAEAEARLRLWGNLAWGDGAGMVDAGPTFIESTGETEQATDAAGVGDVAALRHTAKFPTTDEEVLTDYAVVCMHDTDVRDDGVGLAEAVSFAFVRSPLVMQDLTGVGDSYSITMPPPYRAAKVAQAAWAHEAGSRAVSKVGPTGQALPLRTRRNGVWAQKPTKTRWRN